MNIDIGSARKMILGGMALISVFGLVNVSKKAAREQAFYRDYMDILSVLTDDESLGLATTLNFCSYQIYPPPSVLLQDPQEILLAGD